MSITRHPLHQEIESLYLDHHGWLHGWLRRRLGDSSKAADLAHDTYMRLLERQQPIAAREPRAFLTTVARCVLCNYTERQQLERAYLDALAQLPAASMPSPEERALLLESLLTIDRLLSSLPVTAKRAFLYAQLDGMSQAEIAAKLQISLSTVKRHLVLAYQQCYFAVQD